MTQYIALQASEDVDDLEAELWVRFYEDAIARWVEYAKKPDAELPGSWVAAGKPIPEYGQPLNFHGRSRELIWSTQRPFGVSVHALDGGGGGVVIVDDTRHGVRVDGWIRAGGAIPVPDSEALLSVRGLQPDAAATKARAILDVPDAATMKTALRDVTEGTPAEQAAAQAVLNARGAARSRPVKIARAPDLVDRTALTGAWLDKVDEIEAALAARINVARVLRTPGR